MPRRRGAVAARRSLRRGRRELGVARRRGAERRAGERQQQELQ